MKRYASHRANANNHKARRHYRKMMLSAGYEEHVMGTRRNGLILRYYSRSHFLTTGTLQIGDFTELSHQMWSDEREQLRREDQVRGYQW
jgi:hypothetical protein